MADRTRAAITGCGSYVPEKVITNADLEKMVETSDEWITTRTGISERRMAGPDEATSDMVLPAARQALARAGIEPADLDAIIVCTMTPDMQFPSTACFLQARLAAPPCAAFDLSAACSSYLYGLSAARGLIASAQARHILLAGADALTKITNYEDRTSCILFGDAAGATVVSAAEPGCGHEVLYTSMGADGANGRSMTLPASGTRTPVTHEAIDQRLHLIHLRGREVFNLAVRRIVEVVQHSVAACDLSVNDIGLLVPHQMNLRIMQACAERLGLPMEKVYVNIDRYGNTGAATIPVALAEAEQDGRMQPGDLVVLVAFGGGLTWAGGVVRW